MTAADRNRGAGSVVLGWVITRLAIFGLLAWRSYVVGDVFYYQGKIARLFEVGLPATLNEYPTPVVWILTLPYAITGGNATGYLIAFIAFMLLLDAGFTYALWRSAGRRRDRAVDFWLIFVLLIGPLSYVRFDMIPAVLAGGALLAARRRPALAGALTGIGAAVKLWPALLIAAFAAHKPDRRPALIGFVVAGFGLAALSLVTGGLTRLFSPLTWQSGRGLQIESVWATPVMVARAFEGGSVWQVAMSRFQAFEVFGPGVDAFLFISNLVTVLGLAMIVALLVRAYRRPPDAATVALLVLAIVAIMIVTNKTLSPQYLLWLGGPMAALLLISSTTSTERRIRTRLTIQVLVLAGLTQLVYPVLYDGLLGWWGPVGLVVSTLVTALRNLALVIFAVEICVYAWRLTGSGEPMATSSSPGTPNPAAGERR